MEEYLITTIFKNLPMIKEKLTKEYEFISADTIYLSDSRLNNLKRKFYFEPMPFSKYQKFRLELKKSKSIVPELHSLIQQLILKCILINDQISQDILLKNLIKRFYTKKSIIVKMSKTVGNLINEFPLKYLLDLFEEVELRMFNYIRQKSTFEKLEVDISSANKIIFGLDKIGQDILLTGLKRLTARVFHLPNIENKLLSDLLNDFEDLFKYKQQERLQIQLKKVMKKEFISLSQTNDSINLGTCLLSYLVFSNI